MDIRIDVLQLLDYQINNVLGPLAKLLKRYCHENKTKTWVGGSVPGIARTPSTFGDVGQACNGTLVSAKIAFLLLKVHIVRASTYSSFVHYINT